MIKTDTNYDRTVMVTITEFVASSQRPLLQVKTAIAEADLKPVGQVMTKKVGKPPLLFDRTSLVEATEALDKKRATRIQTKKAKANVEQTNEEALSQTTDDNDSDVLSETGT